MTTTALVEQVQFLEARLDEEQRTITNVRLIRAGMSLNRRLYSMDVLRKAAPLFENVKAYADHDSWFGGRSVRDVTGWFTNVQVGEDGIYATRHFSKNMAGQDSYEMAKDIMQGSAPKSLYGLSINAVGKTKTMRGYDDEGDADVVESIVSVFSVDDVTTPAAGGALLVASHSASFSGELLKHITLEELESSRPDLVTKLKKRWQAVRQTEAVASSKAALDEASATVEQLQAKLLASEKAVSELTARVSTKETELKVVEILRDARLPKAFEEDLRKRLPTIDLGLWPELIEAERRKAMATRNAPPSPPIEVIAAAIAKARPQPVSYERVQTPEEHEAYMKQVQNRS